MKNRMLFPLGKAYGAAFCNRESEIEDLIGNFQSGKHTLLIAPRRYGKSSLAEKAIEVSGYPFARINFHLCMSEQEVSDLVTDHMIKLIGSAIGPVEKIMQQIKKYVSHFEPLLSFGNELASLKLAPKRQGENPAVLITEALLLLEKLLKEKGQKAVLFLDEFQEISRISNNHQLEGAFRTAAQEMTHLSIIFSGSIRSLLLSMFEDESRPLYKLCRKIKLERIEFEKYEKHIQKIAKKSFGETLSPEVFQEIMRLSNRHPYYVNYLCDEIWARCEKSEKLPSVSEVQNAWLSVLEEEWSDALKELSVLPMGQRKVLSHIAKSQSHQSESMPSLLSHEVGKKIDLPASSAATAINSLLERDYIERNPGQSYEIINPLLLSVLQGALS